ncbi:MAG TPA: sigma 54-interacting transcriptional regulator [Polyangia bacterium]|jgi:DNA-binding NtrC family response regulator|nr:sigma 54-interacting transcriptional regulator [Polyangia bacterium]
MSDDTSISQTIRRQAPGTREASRLPLIQVVGSGTSIESLRHPRAVTFGDTLQIGRRALAGADPRAVLTVTDATVSGSHARISRVPLGETEFVIEDLGSTNGTFVGGRRIDGPTRLVPGSIIFLGSHVLIFRTVTPVELVALREDEARPLAPVPTMSPALALTATKLRLLARSNAEILLVGETGAGKEVFASAIHAASGRAGKLVPVNCAAIPKELVESELFGYEKGAHSTAQARKTGLVEAANGGTLFLDEIGDMPIELQSKLLRFLQDKRFSPLGSTRIIEADVRVVAATSRTALDKGGHVQEALLGRLGAQPIALPPLRDRIEDIGRLTAHFLQLAGDERGFEPEAFHALLLHVWPLNVRELSKVVNEASVLSRGAAAIGLEHLPDAVTTLLQVETDEFDAVGKPQEEAPEEPDDDTHVDLAPAATSDAEQSRVREFADAAKTSRVVGKRTRRPAPTREELETQLARCAGSVAEVARNLNRQYAVVWRCIQRYGIDANAYRPPAGPRSTDK